MTRFARALLCVAGLLAPGLATGDGEDGGSTEAADLVIHAGRIHTVSGDTVMDGVIIVRAGKIVGVGPAGELGDLPAGTRVMEFPGQTIVPGLVASATTLGGESRDTRRSLAPDSLVSDSFDFFGDYRRLLEGGVTTLGVSSRSTRLLSGRGLVVKSAGHGDDVQKRVLRHRGGFLVTLGDLSKRPPSVYEPPVDASPDRPFEVLEIQPPVTRSGALTELRKIVKRAVDYRERLVAAQREKSPLPELDAGLIALQDLLQKRDYLHVRVDRANDIARILDLGSTLGLPLVLEGARGAYRLSGLLAEAGVPVIVRGTFAPGRLPAEDLTRAAISAEARDGLAALLAGAGVRVAIASPDDDSLPYLLHQALRAIAHGMDAAAALRAVTLTPAGILGVADRVGSIEVGKDADLLVLDGDPLEGDGRPVAVFIDGELVHPVQEKLDSDKDITVIRCNRVLTVTRGEIPGGIIVVRDGKIVAVGSGELLDLYRGAKKVIDAREETVLPGLIDAGSQLGVHLDTIVSSASASTSVGSGVRISRRSRASSGGGSATYRVVNAIDPADPQFEAVLLSGVTTVILAPAERGRIAGQLTAMKLAGGTRDEAIIRDPVGLLFTSVNDSTLSKAKKYHDAWTAHEKKEAEKKKVEKEAEKKGKERDFAAQKAGEEKKSAGNKKPALPKLPDSNEIYDALRPLLDGKLVAVVRTDSEAVLRSVLAGLTDKYGVKTVVYGLPEISDAMAEEIRRRRVGVLLGPRPLRRKEHREIVHLPRQLATRRIPFGFRSMAGSGSRQLRLQVSHAVREGWDENDALRAMTIDPARFFGLDDRIGSIEKGKDADLVFVRGQPFSLTGVVTRVMVDGTMHLRMEARN